MTVELEAEQHERLRRYCAEVNARYDLELPTWAVLEALVARFNRDPALRDAITREGLGKAVSVTVTGKLLPGERVTPEVVAAWAAAQLMPEQDTLPRRVGGG